MSLIPIVLRPPRANDQFGMGLISDNLLPQRDFSSYFRDLRNFNAELNRDFRQFSQHDAGSIVACYKDKFQMKVDVQQFSPNELTVKVFGDNTVTVEGKHEEKEDEHGYVTRHFTRRYLLPKGYNIDGIKSNLSSDGVLNIIVPKTEEEYKEIPIVQTYQPSTAVEKNQESSDNKKIENKKIEDKKIENKKILV